MKIINNKIGKKLTKKKILLLF